jgi:hypothetical protein
MLGSAMLDVAIGLVFVFLLLSLVCSAANEVIEAVLKNRAFDLERGVRELLSPNGGPKADGIVAQVYDHPLVNGLYKGSYTAFLQHMDRAPWWRWITRVWGPEIPSYIPARNFALAIMDVALPAGAASSGAAGSTADAGVPKPLAPLRAAVAKALDDATASKSPAAQAWKALLVLIDSAGDDAARARDNIEAWFNSSMDRVSGWYKRRAQWFILAIGTILAVAINVDTIHVAEKLYSDKALRDVLVSSAEGFAKSSPTLPAAGAKPDLDNLRALGIPIGWEAERFDADAITKHWLGWLVTAFAVSLGAPFWFDLLNKIIVVRSTVKPQEKSPEEKPKS